MKKYQVVEVVGRHKDVGHAIGESFRESIKNSIKVRKTEIVNYKELIQESKKYYKYTRKIFPKLIEETDAIAKAANVNVIDYFFLNNSEVYDPAEEFDKKESVNPDHCTIAVSYGMDGAIVGHNEDWALDAMDDLYILKAKIGDIFFIGLNYKMNVPGIAASMNNFGLVQCINYLYQTKQFGIPKNYLARAVLECKTLDDAENMIKGTKKASGYNHVLVQEKRVKNIEVGGDKIAVETLTQKSYVHTNHYLAPEMKFLEKFHTKSSERRYKRAKELIKNTKTANDMEKLLCDRKDVNYPICRADATIGSVIAIPSKEEFWVNAGNPCMGEYIQY